MQSRSWLLSLLGFRHGLCVAATTLRQQSVFRCLDVVLLRTHNDLVGWAQEVDMCLCGDIPAMNIIGFALISCTTVNPLGGLLSVWPCALPAMFGGVPPIPFPGDPFPFQGCQAPLNCAHCQRMFGADWQERLSSCRWFNGSFSQSTSPWLRMSVPPVGASILFRCPHLPIASTFFKVVSQRFHVINSQLVPVCFNGHSLVRVALFSDPLF